MVLEKNINISIKPPGDHVANIELIYNSNVGWAMDWMTVNNDRYVRTKNIVTMAPFTFLTIRDQYPKEEYFQFTEEEMIAYAAALSEYDFIQMERSCGTSVKELKNYWMAFSQISYLYLSVYYKNHPLEK